MNDESEQLLARIHELVTARLEGRLGPGEQAQLEDLLETDPAARRLYLQYMTETAGLLWWAGHAAQAVPELEDASPEQPSSSLRETETMILPTLRLEPEQKTPIDPSLIWSPPKYAPEAPWWSWRKFGWKAAAVLLAGGLAAGFLLRGTFSGAPARVATLVDAADAQWADGAGVPVPGERLSPSELRLTRGRAKIRFDDGATIVLDSPAKLRLIDRGRAFLTEGRLRAVVPHEASGFRIDSTGLSVVDLGTEFGLAVAQSGRAEVDVFRGQVSVTVASDRTPAARTIDVTASHAIAVASLHTVTTGAADDAAFPRDVRDPFKPLADWEFEGPITPVPPTSSPDESRNPAVADASGSGHPLSVWPGRPGDGMGQPAFSGDVPPANMMRSASGSAGMSYNPGAASPIAPGMIFSDFSGGASAQLGSDFTLEGYFKTAGDQSSSGPMTILNAATPSGSDQFLVSLNETRERLPKAGAMRFSVFGDTGLSVGLSGQNFADGEWHYFAASYRAATSSSAGSLTLMTVGDDGQLFRNSVPVPSGFRILPADPVRVQIGSRFGVRPVSLRFRGLINRIRITPGIVPGAKLLAPAEGDP